MSKPNNETKPMVYIVDDDEPIRDSISMLLDTLDIPNAVFADAQSFLDAVDSSSNGIAVLDIRMPGMSGLDLQDKLIAQGSNLPIVFITGHGDVPMAVEAMKKGAIDFIRKPFRDQELLDSISEALSSEKQAREHEANIGKISEQANTLTPREQEVFERVAQGQANKVVAIDLEISERTVEIHRSQVMKKMNVRSLAALVRCKLLLEQASK